MKTFFISFIADKLPVSLLLHLRRSMCIGWLLLWLCSATTWATTVPVDEVLKPDGTLNPIATAHRQVTLDLKGWDVRLDPKRGPVFTSLAANAFNSLDKGLDASQFTRVQAIAISGSDVYVGGTFSGVGTGGTAVTGLNNIAKWNGTGWQALDKGLDAVFIDAIAIIGSDVYVGGRFNGVGAGGTAVAGLNNIAKWNGSSWQALDKGLDSFVAGMAVSGADLYVCGYFNRVGTGGTPVAGLNAVAKWNGSVWSALETGLDHRAFAIAASGNDVYVGGRFSGNIAKWNGSSWSDLDKGLNNWVTAIAISGSDVYIGGDFTDVGSGGTPVEGLNHIAKWNGTGWQALDKGLNDDVRILTVSGGEVFAGGLFNEVGTGGTPVEGLNHIAKWNGTGWSALDKGLNNNVAALAVGGNNVYIGGEFSDVGVGGTQAEGLNRIARWELPSITLGTITPLGSCGGANGSIAFSSAGIAPGSQTLQYKKDNMSASASVTVAANGSFTLTGLGAGTYTEFAIGAVTATGSASLIFLYSDKTEHYWIGCSNTQWHTASNWNKGSVPTANDDVIIPFTASNQPSISTVDAVAKTVELLSGATLTIAASGVLAVNGFKGPSNSTKSFYNGGTVQNNGQLLIGNTSSSGTTGLRNIAEFYNNTGAEITIDNTTNTGLDNSNSGIFNNTGKVSVGKNNAVGYYGILNAGTFNNTSGGELSMDRAYLFNVSGTFTNKAKIIVGQTTTVGSVWIENYSTFKNEGCSALINIISNSRIDNSNTFTNSGTLIENSTNNSTISTNTGIVYNLNGGNFTITTNTGTVTTSANDNYWKGCTSTNWATASNWSKGAVPLATDDVILPGAPLNRPTIMAPTTAVAKSVEVKSGDTLTITASGSLTINGSKTIDSYTIAFYNNGRVENSGRILIGNTASAGQIGIQNQVAFINNAGAEITIDSTSSIGLYNHSGTFTNAAKIAIGRNASVGKFGFVNEAPFYNNTGGEITIDKTTSCLYNRNIFDNLAKITIGKYTPVGGTGIRNENTFQNKACAELTLFYRFANTNSFTNEGLLTLNTALPHENSGLTNNGIIEYPQGNPIPNVTNNDLIIVPITTCSTITPALQIGGANSFTVGTNWYKESALTNIAGTYAPNTFTITNLAGGSTYPLYFSVTDPANSCSRTVSISTTVNPIPTANISGTGAVCKDAPSLDITFTGSNGTAPYTFTYKINNGNNLTVTTTAGNSVTLSQATAVGGTFAYSLVSISDNNSCAQSQNGSATITVLAPSIPTSPTGGTISLGQSINLTANGCSGEGFTLLWYKSVNNSQVTMPVSPTVTTSYYARCQQSSGPTNCLSPKTADVIVVVGQRIFVNTANANPSQDGTTWVKAFASLQAALTVAGNSVYSPVEIWVAQGTYTPGTLRKDAFVMPSGVKVYGGFVGTEDSLHKRNWKTRVTTLSGEIGTVAKNDNVHHVVLFSATNDSTRLDGFSIRGGYAEFFAGNQNTNLNDPEILTSGGGILAINKSKGAITHCTITDNRASAGGGIHLRDTSQVRITQSILFGNEANFGGGVYVSGGSAPFFENVLIVNNKGLGAGLYVNRSQPVLINCTIASNKDENSTAGGILNSNASTTVKNSILWGNTGLQSNAGSVISYSLVAGGYSGTGNKNQDPLFVSANPVGLAPMGSLGDYHVLPCSPAIDAANNSEAALVDLEGNVRPFATGLAIADMGVYESQTTGTAGPNHLEVTENITSGTVLKTGGWVTATNQISNATVIYQATKSVTLQPSFSATATEGKSFQALIGGCP